MKFEIEQIALYPRDPVAAKELLAAMGAVDWAEDHVVATGHVRGATGTNEADLSFNYDLLDKARELEVLHYTAGPNWMMGGAPRVSHLGTHCTEEELDFWLEFFENWNIPIAQAVHTKSHTNPNIPGKRKWRYVIFDTYSILGVDIKFIVRIE